MARLTRKLWLGIGVATLAGLPPAGAPGRDPRVHRAILQALPTTALRQQYMQMIAHQ